ncbi:MAG: hypothetical protein ABIQ56_04255, partial [Chitinophagaceae bacterium]
LKNTLTVILFLSFSGAFAQIGNITLIGEKDKPEKFKTKTLKSEKTGEKKFTLPRRIMQNTTTHYNYYFNATNKINAVIERARMSGKEDYTKLLPFYGYSLDNTASQASELDSVIYKATAGILLHDLRSDWVDNMYLLIGKAYLLRKDFDSASMTFQFINYNLYPRKKKDEDQLIVGTNENASDRVISIANKEKRNILQKAFTKPPSRNDALVWQARNLVEMTEYPDAAGLINTLHADPNLPLRLKDELEEVHAYWFYKQEMYDSTVTHLSKALSNAADKQDLARREFLIAQLYEKTKNIEKANEYYARAIRHTVDPLMDIYARLNRAKMSKSNDPAALNNSIDNLVKMARRDKFETYRDILFYSAAELALEKPDTSEAISYLKKSIEYNQTNPSFKNKAFLKLADFAYARKDFRTAFAFYDSLQSADSSLGVDLAQLLERRNALSRIVEKINIVEREDSLQRVAAMSPADREALLKKIVKRLRKEQGLKDEDVSPSINAFTVFDPNKNSSADLFATNDKGDFYFYNSSLKARGFTEFKSKWGKRLNVDNWRTKTASDAAIVTNPGKSPTDVILDNSANPGTGGTGEISIEALTEKLPLTPEKLKLSHALLSGSLFDLGKLYQNTLEEYGLATKTYEESLSRYPDSLYNGELYMNLYYCYQKIGDMSKANYYKNLLTSKFNGSTYANNVSGSPTTNPAVGKNIEATKRYDAIYNLFIEGQFEQAISEKKAADSLYGENFWNPQLLYIEAVYHIRQRNDSAATIILKQIINKYPGTPLNLKAANMLEVLGKRTQIESYLTTLQVERAKDDSLVVIKDNNVNPQLTNNLPVNGQPVNPQVNVPVVTNLPTPTGPFSFNPAEAQYVVMVLDKVDAVFASEARNAFNRYNREKFASQAIEIRKDVMDKDRSLLLFSNFKDAEAAIAYTTRIRKDAGSEVSWLPPAKYSFIILSESNLQLLKQNKDLQGYKSLLNSRFPGIF